MPAVTWPCPHCGGALSVSLEAAGQAAQAAARLTPREREVLARVAAGETVEQIATALGIQRQTASWHLTQAIARLGARTRSEAVATALRLSLIDGP
jgi:LuxR family transcriptional regulator, regulator of acetate metabolism